MEVTHEYALAAYLKARVALDSISRSPKATDAQKKIARQQRDELDIDFIESRLDSIEARTEQYVDFSKRIREVVEKMTSEALLRGLRELTEVVVEAKHMIGNDL